MKDKIYLQLQIVSYFVDQGQINILKKNLSFSLEKGFLDFQHIVSKHKLNTYMVSYALSCPFLPEEE